MTDELTGAEIVSAIDAELGGTEWRNSWFARDRQDNLESRLVELADEFYELRNALASQEDWCAPEGAGQFQEETDDDS